MAEYVVRGTVNLLAILILGYMIKRNDVFSSKARRAWLLAVAAVGIAVIAEVITLSFVAPNRIHRIINMIFCVIGFGISPFIPLLMADVFEDQTDKPWLRLGFLLPATVSLVLSVLSPAFGFIFYHSPGNEYFRGTLFLAYVIAYFFGISIFLFRTLLTIKRYQCKNKGVLLGIVLFILFGTSIQVFWKQFLTSWLTVTLVSILGYAYYVELLEKQDVMTHLLNRRSYEQRLKQLALRGRGSIIFFDVDNFKLINDQYGHQFGDTCLITIASVIRDSFGKIGLCYRIGGDEFCVLSECGDVKTIQEAKLTFLKNIDLAQEKDPKIPYISLGHAICNPGLGFEEVVATADRQLFSYKQQRK